MNRFAAAVTLCAFCAAACNAAFAAKLTPQDHTWIDTCIAQRKDDRLADAKTPRHTIAQLRSYCICMQGIVDGNQPFTVSELEHSYPPAHLMCLRKAGKKTRKPERWRLCGSQRTMAVASEQAAQHSGTPRCVPLR